ncbi:MAG: protease modulator HflK [Verrucomicrobiota bacterium]|jgi:membrane protease subunit HflK
MSHDHEPDHTHEPPAPVTPDDAGSQALAEALRSSFAIVKVVMLLMVLAFFSSGFFTVGPSEKAVILRFGRPVGEGEKVLLNSGWHWSYPYPIDEVVKIPITEIQKVNSTVGWYATTPEQELSGEELPAGSSLNPAVDGYAITADRNIIHTRAMLYYHVADPIRFVFDFMSASNTVQNALDNALLYTAAHFNVDDVLTRDVAGFRDAVLQRVSDLTEQEQLGIVIDQCEVQSIPPRQLQDVFTRVTTARENRNKLLNEAHSYENQVLSQSGAQASSITNAAAADRARFVESITAEAKRFSDLLPKYESNPGLFAQKTLVEMMGPILTNVQDKIFLPERADGKPRELRLMLNREPPAPKTAAPNP